MTMALPARFTTLITRILLFFASVFRASGATTIGSRVLLNGIRYHPDDNHDEDDD
jgi:hypothetical protein